LRSLRMFAILFSAALSGLPLRGALFSTPLRGRKTQEIIYITKRIEVQHNNMIIN
jgi:hypothetical protein